MRTILPDNEKLKFWWQQCLHGDTTAFASIHKALFEGLYNYAHKLLNDEDLADDAIQDLFIKIWNRRATIGTLENIKAFFFTSLRRQILNQLRDLKLKQLRINHLSGPDIEFSQEEIMIKKEADS